MLLASTLTNWAENVPLPQVTETLVTFADPTVPDPLATEQV